MRTITIAGKEYRMKYTLRALFVYEEITGRPYKGERLLDSYVLMYAMLMANNKEADLTFDGMIDACDGDSSLFSTFLRVLEDEGKRVGMLAGNDSDGKKKAE